VAKPEGRTAMGFVESSWFDERIVAMGFDAEGEDSSIG
jgi:hypothetical protein